MMNVRSLFLMVAVLVLVSACGREDSNQPQETISEMHAQFTVPEEYAGLENPVPVSSETIHAGEQIFRVNCSSCHGESGKGDGAAARALNPKPSDLSAVAVLVEDAYLFWRIAEGGAELKSAMPAWKKILTEEQIWQEVVYIRSLAGK